MAWRGRSAPLWLVGLLAAAVLGTGVVGVRALGWLQPLELDAYDRLLRARPEPPRADPRIALVRIYESDIQRYGHPLPDALLARVFETLSDLGARAIGADLYRDRPVPPGTEALERVVTERRIVLIEKLGDKPEERVPPPGWLEGTSQVAFSDLKTDPDGAVRRGLLVVSGDGSAGFALSLRLVLQYLAHERVFPRWKGEELWLRDAHVRRFSADDGGYAGADDRGYQTLLDYAQGQKEFDAFSLEDVIERRVPAEGVEGRIVLLGTTSPSVQDHHDTPFGGKTFGMVIHAHTMSQLLGIALDARPQTRVWSERAEALWILAWALAGGLLALGVRSPWALGPAVLAGGVALVAGGYGLLLRSLWVPVVPPLLAWAGGTGLVVAWVSFRERAERRDVMGLLGRFIAPDVAEQVWRERGAFMDGGRPRPQSATITVLMSDLKGFTSASEDMPPESLMEWLNEYMDAMAHLVGEHGGVVDNYIGDGLVAEFGVPVPRRSEAEIDADAVAAVECALAMGEEMRRLNQRWHEAGLPPGRVRIGLFTGKAVLGVLGVERAKYTALGDTVNTASRLESFDKEGFDREAEERPQDSHFRLLVGEPTFLRLAGRFEGEFVGTHALKGKDEKISIHRIYRHAGATPRSGSEETP